MWWWLAAPRTTGVCTLVWWDDRLLVVRQSYKPGLALPGGGLGRGETPADAAARELREEVGMALPSAALRPLCELQTGYEGRRERLFAYEVVADVPPELSVDRREIVWAGFRSRQELAAVRLWAPLPELLEHSQRGRGPTGAS